MNTNTKRITHYITALISVVVLVCIDQFTKYLVVGHLKDRPAYVLIRNIFQLEYLENRGAAFGLSLIHISEPTRLHCRSRMPSSA